MKKKLIVALMVLLGAIAVSCGYDRMYATGTNAWNVGISSGVSSHYYSY